MVKKKTSKAKHEKKKSVKKKPNQKILPPIQLEEIEKKEDTYDSHGCEFINEAECEEEMDAEGLDFDEEEKKHFEEEKEE